MFCTYVEGKVHPLRGEFKSEAGTFPRAWLRAVTKAQRDALGVYWFTDQKARPDQYHRAGAPIDTLDAGEGRVTRTYAIVDKNVDQVRQLINGKVMGLRATVAHAGITFSSKPFSTDSTTVESINLIAMALLDGGTFPGGTLPWDTMETPSAPTKTFNATEAQFKAFRNAVAAHFVLCTKAARTHFNAIDALTTFAELEAYDYTTGWPANPSMEEV